MIKSKINSFLNKLCIHLLIIWKQLNWNFYYLDDEARIFTDEISVT